MNLTIWRWALYLRDRLHGLEKVGSRYHLDGQAALDFGARYQDGFFDIAAESDASPRLHFLRLGQGEQPTRMC